MTAPVPAPVPEPSSAAAVLDNLLAALADLPPHLRRLRPSPWADWISDVRGEHAAKRDQLNDHDPG